MSTGHGDRERILVIARSSAIAEGPRDASRQLKFCQLRQLYDKS